MISLVGKVLIVLEGVPGSGKTTYWQSLKEQCETSHDPRSNKIVFIPEFFDWAKNRDQQTKEDVELSLKKQYETLGEYPSFQFLVQLLTYQMLCEFATRINQAQIIIADRWFFSEILFRFALGLQGDPVLYRQYDIFGTLLFGRSSKGYDPARVLPQMFAFNMYATTTAVITLPSDLAFERIKTRGRPEEECITEDYVNLLSGLWREMIPTDPIKGLTFFFPENLDLPALSDLLDEVLAPKNEL